MKQRLIVLTDIYRRPKDRQTEIDDVQSMIRLLLYANEIDIEGLIAASSFCYIGGKAEDKKTILDIIDAYAECLDNLRVHDGRYPDAEYLRKVTKRGIEAYGRAVGNGFADEKYTDNEGVHRIIEAVDRDDPRPVWIGIWGGANTLAQAIWQAEREKSADEFDRFIRKLRIYGIADQDHAGRWLRETYGAKLFYIVSPSSGDDRKLAGMEFALGTWTGFSSDFSMKWWGGNKLFAGADNTLVSAQWIRKNVQGKSPFRKLYPIPKFSMEGDTPSYLGLIDNGLNDMEHPNYGGWGGRYEFGFPQKYPKRTTPEKFPIWTDAEDTITLESGQTVTNNFCTIYRFRKAYQNDFLARLCWSEEGTYQKANHYPVITDRVPGSITVQAGEKVTLSAKGSFDPDGDTLSYKWWSYTEAGSYEETIAFKGDGTDTVIFEAPDKAGTLHIILELTDNGTPPLTRYRRIIVTVVDGGKW